MYACAGAGGWSASHTRHVCSMLYPPVHKVRQVEARPSKAYIGQYSTRGDLFVAAYQDSHVRVFDSTGCAPCYLPFWIQMHDVYMLRSIAGSVVDIGTRVCCAVVCYALAKPCRRTRLCRCPDVPPETLHYYCPPMPIFGLLICQECDVKRLTGIMAGIHNRFVQSRLCTSRELCGTVLPCNTSPAALVWQ